MHASSHHQTHFGRYNQANYSVLVVCSYLRIAQRKVFWAITSHIVGKSEHKFKIRLWQILDDYVIQGHPLGIDTKSRPGLTRCFDKSTKKWCSVASWVVEIYAWSTIWNFFDLMWPQWPQTEKVLKFNMSYHDSVKFLFFILNLKIK